MKKYLVMVLAVALSITANSQEMTFTPKKSSGGGGVNVSQSVDTGETIYIEGTNFKVHALESGTKFIKCNSPRTGNDYPVWVFTPTEYEYDGHKVYQTKKGTYCIYRISVNSGNPYPQWLDNE